MNMPKGYMYMYMLIPVAILAQDAPVVFWQKETPSKYSLRLLNSPRPLPSLVERSILAVDHREPRAVGSDLFLPTTHIVCAPYNLVQVALHIHTKIAAVAAPILHRAEVLFKRRCKSLG